jgi:hypothetical protein
MVEMKLIEVFEEHSFCDFSIVTLRIMLVDSISPVFI